MRVGSRHPWSLTRRLVWSSMAIVLATAILQIGLVYRAMLKEAHEVFDAQLQQAAQALVQAAPIRAAAPVAGDAAPAEELELLIRERGPAGELRSTSSGLFPAQVPAGFSEFESRLGRLRVYTARIGDRDASVGQRLDARRELAREIALSALWPLLALAVAGLGLLSLIVRSVLRPLTALARQLEQRDPAALTPLADPGLPTEMSPLLLAANGLIERLTGAFEHQRRFLADAAHELRTPIAAIGLQNTLVARAESAGEREAALAAQGAGIRRASALVDQLMRLSRLEASEAPLRLTRFDVLDELETMASVHRPEADDKGIALRVCGQPVFIEADAEVFSTVMGNLIGNAVRHCPPGSRVFVRAEETGPGPQVAIEDNGPGIPDEDLDAVFRPFHRNAAAGTPGAGLGLSIARAACIRAGWTLELARAPSGGLRATVRLGGRAARVPPRREGRTAGGA